MGQVIELKHREVARIADKFADSPYSLGDTSKGWDCLSMIIDFYEAIGGVLPDEYKGFTRDNYAEKWMNGEGREELYTFLQMISEQIDTNFARAGDLMIFDSKDTVMPAIYLGNATMLICVENKGCFAVPYRFFKANLIEVRRWVVL